MNATPTTAAPALSASLLHALEELETGGHDDEYRAVLCAELRNALTTAPALSAAPVLVRSASRPGLLYEVSPDYCPCESFRFSRATPATCKHVAAAFPLKPLAPCPAAVPFCIDCGWAKALDTSLRCAICQDDHYAAEMAAVNAEADTLPDSSPEDIAYTQGLMAEVERELVASTLSSAEQNAIACRAHGLPLDGGRLSFAQDPATLFA